MQFLRVSFLLWLLACATVQAQVVETSELVPAYAKVPVGMGGFFNSTIEMTAEVFKPEGREPFPVVVYSHGRSSTARERADIKEVIPRDYLRFWLAHGFAVVAPLRPGYGKTGGPDREIPGHAWSSNGTCTGTPDYRKVMNIAAPTVLATIAWLNKQAWANTSSIVLTGNSVGGLLTVATASHNPTGVIGFVNFAGGIGGNPALSPGRNCDPDQLRDMFAEYGKTAKLPSLWMYAENDQFWGPETPKGWHAAFAKGGSATQLFSTGPLAAKDGHELLFIGKDLWFGPMTAFLKQLGY